MSKKSEIENTIPRIYKRTALNLLMFGFVTGVRDTLPTVTIRQALYMFAERYGVEEGVNIDSLLVAFNDMQKEFKDR